MGRMLLSRTVKNHIKSPYLRTVDEVAEEVHKGQKRDGRDPYIGHPRRVRDLAMSIAFNMDLDEVEIIAIGAVALGHDIMEDSNLRPADLLKKGLHVRDIYFMEKLNKKKYVTHADYMKAIRFHRVPSIVKYADILDNTAMEIKGNRKDKYDLSKHYLDEKWNIKEYL